MWTFSVTPSSRLTYLDHPPSFEEITESIKQSMAILCRHEVQCGDDSRFFRAVYCIKIAEPLFDLFFNSAHGYRGWYYRSAHKGLEMNSVFIGALRPALLASGSISNEPHSDAGESLASGSAKAWLAERSMKLCDNCAGEWSPPQDDVPEVMNGRWEFRRPGYGSKAPYLTKIRVIGAFLNEHGDEFVPARKRHRAEEIHNTGWS